MATKARKEFSAVFIFRQCVHAGFTLFFLYAGYRFLLYFLWATGQRAEAVAKPMAVEAFLPVGAFAAAKLLLITGEFDSVHPAALVILLMSVITAFLFRKSVCGYMCPVGYVCGFLARLGKKMRISWTPGPKMAIVLSLPKYLLLALFVWLIWFGMDARSISAFLQTPYYHVADSRMLTFFLYPSTTILVSLLVLAVLSIGIPLFWCRVLCPYGALLGVFSWFSPVAVTRNEKQCIKCQRCSRQCLSWITVHNKESVRSAECTGCLECTTVCPVENCLTVGCGYGKQKKKLPYWSICIGAITVLLLFFCWAVDTGKWAKPMSAQEVRDMHEVGMVMTHP